MSFSVEQNFAAQYDGVKAPDPGPGPMVSGPEYTERLLPTTSSHTDALFLHIIGQIKNKINFDFSPDTAFSLMITCLSLDLLS